MSCIQSQRFSLRDAHLAPAFNCTSTIEATIQVRCDHARRAVLCLFLFSMTNPNHSTWLFCSKQPLQYHTVSYQSTIYGSFHNSPSSIMCSSSKLRYSCIDFIFQRTSPDARAMKSSRSWNRSCWHKLATAIRYHDANYPASLRQIRISLLVASLEQVFVSRQVSIH